MSERAHEKEEHPVCELDREVLHRGLRSADAVTRAKAVRSICPCRLGWKYFEEVIGLLEQMKKDPDPVVRASAIHVFEDACEMESSKLPTSPQMVTNSMVATRFQMRGLVGDEDLVRAEKANSKARDRERRRRRI